MSKEEPLTTNLYEITTAPLNMLRGFCFFPFKNKPASVKSGYEKTQNQVGSLAGAAHLLNGNAGVLRRAH